MPLSTTLARTASLAAFLGVGAAPALANYSFTRIDAPGTLTGVYAGNLNNSGEVVFTGFHSGGSSGIYRGSGGPLTTIASTVGSSFTYFNAPFINCPGEVAFRGLSSTGYANGAYKGSGGPVSLVYGASNGVDVGGIDCDGTVVFYDNNIGVMTGSGGTPTVIAPLTGGPFAGLGNIPDIHCGKVVFQAIMPSGKSAAYSSTGGVLTQESVAGGSAADIQQPRVSSAGSMAWYSNLTSGDSAIVTSIGGSISNFVDTSGPYSHFGFSNSHAINFYGQVAFSALQDALPGEMGIFTGPNPSTDRVVGYGDTLSGKTVQDVYFGGLNDLGQICFGVQFSDFTYGMFRADPDVLNPDPGCCVPAPGLASLALGGVGLAARRRR